MYVESNLGRERQCFADAHRHALCAGRPERRHRDRKPWGRSSRRLHRRSLAPDAARRAREGAVRGKNGTRITIGSSERACSLVDNVRRKILSLLTDFTWLNPHLSLSGVWCGDFAVVGPATDPEWRKWRPNMPTSPHWYDAPRLFRLMAATVAHAEDHRLPCPTVRDFIREFRGLSSTGKAAEIGETVGAAGESLADFHRRGEDGATRLLSAMRLLSRPVPPRDLGMIGKAHLLEMAKAVEVDEESFQYRPAAFEAGGLPYTIETAFALREGEGAHIVEGFNFAPAVGDSPFRLEGKLAQQMIGGGDPVVAFAHLVSPRLEFLDRGKARVALPFEVNAKLNELVSAVTERWRKQRKAEERHGRAAERRHEALRASHRPVTLNAAAFEAMKAAYLKASANATLPANARQIYYAARPAILARTGKNKLNSDYFIQTLLIDYIEANDCEWDVALTLAAISPSRTAA